MSWPQPREGVPAAQHLRGHSLSLTAVRVLRVLLDGETYGMEIVSRTRIGSGAVYPAVARMESAGLLIPRPEAADPHEAGRPSRRYYRLTPEGRVYACALLSALADELKPPPGAEDDH